MRRTDPLVSHLLLQHVRHSPTPFGIKNLRNTYHRCGEIEIIRFSAVDIGHPAMVTTVWRPVAAIVATDSFCKAKQNQQEHLQLHDANVSISFAMTEEKEIKQEWDNLHFAIEHVVELTRISKDVSLKSPPSTCVLSYSIGCRMVTTKRS